jgi:nicotinamidase-related amidase
MKMPKLLFHRVHECENAAILLALGFCLLACFTAPYSRAGELELTLQSRDRDTGKARASLLKFDSSKTAIVVVDMWNWHWCKTATERVGAMVPRMDRCLIEARELGIQVFFCPTDTADAYIGTPQRERVFAFPSHELPKLPKLEIPSPPNGPGCACGREKCEGSIFGWDGMHPALSIHENDLMPNSAQSLYSICKEKGIETLIYMGVHTQACLLGKSIGLSNMKRAGLHCVLARDLTDSHPDYDPGRIDPDDLTARTVAHFERYLCPTINMTDELKRLDLWPDQAPVDPVRLAPWGTPMRPHLFEKPVTLTLAAPWHQEAVIHYTTDGSAPSEKSPRYDGPLVITGTTRLRAQAFQAGVPVCIETVGHFAKLSPVPPMPKIFIGDLTALRAVGPGHTYGEDDHHRFAPDVNPPQKDLTNQGKPLRLRKILYEHGLGVHATNQMMYTLRPEYHRFVALAGVDEYIIDKHHGSNLGKHPSVIFRIFIDGELAAESPVMRISFEPWRFNVKIPDGARIISLCATDAGDGNKQDFANWVNAGFVVE